MIKLLALFAILCGVLLAYGAMTAPRDRMGLRGKREGRSTWITVDLPQMTERYEWLGIHICSADVGEDGRTFCNGEWERESSQAIDPRRTQIVREFKDIRGTVFVEAMAFSRDGDILAAKALTLFLN